MEDSWGWGATSLPIAPHPELCPKLPEAAGALCPGGTSLHLSIGCSSLQETASTKAVRRSPDAPGICSAPSWAPGVQPGPWALCRSSGEGCSLLRPKERPRSEAGPTPVRRAGGGQGGCLSKLWTGGAANSDMPIKGAAPAAGACRRPGPALPEPGGASAGPAAPPSGSLTPTCISLVTGPRQPDSPLLVLLASPGHCSRAPLSNSCCSQQGDCSVDRGDPVCFQELHVLEVGCPPALPILPPTPPQATQRIPEEQSWRPPP